MPNTLRIYQGDDYSAVVTITDPDGAPADLTGYSARAQIRRGEAAQTPIVYDIPTQITGADIVLNIPATITETLHGRYRWDLELVAPTAVRTTVLSGGVLVTPEVTRVAV